MLTLAGGFHRNGERWYYEHFGRVTYPAFITALDRLEELEDNEQAMNDHNTAMALEIGRLGRLLGEAESREIVTLKSEQSTSEGEG
tara:strand:+ start:1593 stop:1850 length:258 start_codon:yes stop_codon:yes gene_type:complete